MFDDLYRHIPLLFTSIFAGDRQACGAGGMEAILLNGCEVLARSYWYTVEFDLVDRLAGLRAFGVGLLSSACELRHCVTSPAPQRLGFVLERTWARGTASTATRQALS